jgi:two-component system cell cycle sensor histidine kinase/response regulator CckA
MKKKQILIVEDERIVADDIKMSLERLGYIVPGIVHSGEEAIKKVKDLSVDLVLMDIVLEGKMDGIEAASTIRTRFNIPVVYLTAYSDDTTLGRAKATEPFGYILKPFEDKDLQVTIEVALYKHMMDHKLAESEKWLSTTIHSIGDAVITTDTKGGVTFMNPFAQTLTGWKLEDAVSNPLNEIFVIINEKTGRPLGDPVARALKQAEPTWMVHDTDTILIAKDGTRYYINYSCAPITFETGNIAGAVLAFQDITEQRKVMDELKKAYAELKKTQQDLIQSEKLAALGRFSSGVAHEIKNPLGIILGGSEFLEAKLSKSRAEVKTVIKKIKDATLRSNSIVQGLLKYARPAEIQAERARPEDLIKEALFLFKYTASSSNIKIETKYAKEELWINADKNQIQQVLLNLLLNAMEAMPRSGKIKIKTYKTEESEYPSDKPFCVIEVADSGEGISKENLQKIFEPFFTTKRDRKGTGLGLSMAQMIIDNHKGRLRIDSEPGEGTTARIILPLARQGK